MLFDEFLVGTVRTRVRVLGCRVPWYLVSHGTLVCECGYTGSTLHNRFRHVLVSKAAGHPGAISPKGRIYVHRLMDKFLSCALGRS